MTHKPTNFKSGTLGLAADPIDFAPFERRLNGTDDAPVAIAVSGGGDSLALLLAARRWADRRGRRLVALTVDHGLQPDGAAWARWTAERCRRLGVSHRSLRWEGEKPSAGLPAAARAARHALLAKAAREVGARVILLGHTADDRMEAEVMRGFGASVPTPREWSPSPVWPEGRGVFLLRPLLASRRADLRAWLESAGERWIEDPANDDPRFARALARRRLAAGEACADPRLDHSELSGLDPAAIRFGPAGEFDVPRALLRDAGRLLGALCLCAGGGDRPPRRAAIGRLEARLAGPANVTAVLAGARLEADADRVLICREAGEFRRAGVSSTPLAPGGSVFDGRFLLSAPGPGWSVRPLRGLGKRLPRVERAALAGLAAAARGGLPAVAGPDGALTCPVLAQGGLVSAIWLGRERLLAAIGALQNEASMQRVAKPAWDA